MDIKHLSTPAMPVNCFKVGNSVLCRDNEGKGGEGLFFGKTYKVSRTVGKVGEVDAFDCPLGWISVEQDFAQRLLDPRRFSLIVDEDGDVAEKPLPLKLQAAIVGNTMAAMDALGLEDKDMVTLPDHYARYKIEPIRFICENNLDFFQGNVVKYTVRHDAKNGLEDLRKAQRYLEMYIEFLSGNADWWKRKAPSKSNKGEGQTPLSPNMEDAA